MSSGSFNTNNVGSFYFTFNWSRASYSTEGNYSVINYNVIARNTPGYYRSVYAKNLWIAGQHVFSASSGVTCYDGTEICSGQFTLYHDSHGNCNFSASFDAGVGIYSGNNASGSGAFTLPNIPRYLNRCDLYPNNTFLEALRVNWVCDPGRDWTQYRINGGQWNDAHDNVSADNKSGWFDIWNLSPNIAYSIQIRLRRADSGLWSESNVIYMNTKDIGRITSVTDMILGETVRLIKTNPAVIFNRVRIETLNPLTNIAIRDETADDMYITLTDDELDKLYKKMENNNHVTIRYVVDTISNSNTYHDFVDKVCYLKGNQKTMRKKIASSWKRGKGFIKINDNWKKGVMWYKVNDTWKRCI